MEPKEMFAIWAPPDAIWSRWAKPVIFMQKNLSRPSISTPTSAGSMYGFDAASPSSLLFDLQEHPLGTSPTSPSEPSPAASPAMPTVPTIDPNAVPPSAQDTAIVVNLAGADSVLMGILLAKNGYRPVPLYNASDGPGSVIPLGPIVDSMTANNDTLQQLNATLAPDSPPAFLIDANRLGGGRPPLPGRFDNRWLVFPQDFPSSIFMYSYRIRRVILLQRGQGMDDDLAQVLLRWKQGNLELLTQNPYLSSQEPTADQTPVPLTVNKPSRFGMWYRVMMLRAFSPRRSSAGGFGGIIPIPTSSSG